jgi:hypothetical protein
MACLKPELVVGIAWHMSQSYSDPWLSSLDPSSHGTVDSG